MTMKRRALVLTDDTARHPFRASLPPHVRLGIEPQEPVARRWRLTRTDWRDFLGAYCASFVMVSAFIA